MTLTGELFQKPGWRGRLGKRIFWLLVLCTRKELRRVETIEYQQ